MRQWKESFPGDPFISSGFRCGVLFSRPCLSSAVDWRRCVGHISPTDEATPRSRDICEPNVWRRHFHAQCLERFDHWMMYMCQDHDIHTLTTGTYWDASWNDIGFRVITVLSELLEFISKAPPPPPPPRSLDCSQLGSVRTRLLSHCWVSKIEPHGRCSGECGVDFHFQTQPSGSRARGSLNSSSFRLSSAHRHFCLNRNPSSDH